MNEKYLPKQVRVLVEDQIGNQRIITIDAKWDRIRVNQQSGARVQSIPTATLAYVPKGLENRGLKIDLKNGTFAKDTINVAKEDADRKYNEQVQKGINDFYAESAAKEAKETSEDEENNNEENNGDIEPSEKNSSDDSSDIADDHMQG